MLHWLVVGHIHPRDPIGRAERPYKPKATQPIPKGTAERALDGFGRDIDPYLSHGEAGSIVGVWAQASYKFRDRAQAFAHALAEREGRWAWTSGPRSRRGRSRNVRLSSPRGPQTPNQVTCCPRGIRDAQAGSNGARCLITP